MHDVLYRPTAFCHTYVSGLRICQSLALKNLTILLLTRHRASTSMYSLTFCVHVMLPVARTPPLEARSPGRRSNVENAPRRRPVTSQPAMPTSHIRHAILRTFPSPAGHWLTARADPAERSHYMSSYRRMDASL